MEFFNKASAIRLQSHLVKYLAADDDQTTVRQSRNGSSKKALWTVEFIQGNPLAIRLKSCHGGYLMASDEAYLLGATGNKVVQSDPGAEKDGLLEWEPIKEGFRVKLKTRGGKFLRANGGTPPWRNTITHDLPQRTVTQDWIMWYVDVVDISMLENQYLISNVSSLPSMNDDFSVTDSPSFQSEAMEHRWPSIVSDEPSQRSERGQGGMEFFDKAKAVRLQGHSGKYLIADDDQQTVRQSRDGSSNRARWTVEFTNGKCNTIRLKSCHGLYLAASSELFLLGMTGKKVIQTRMENLTDVSIEWEPVKEGLDVKLMTKDGTFLRANSATPPWRNSVTHDVPYIIATQNWVLWGVDVLDAILSESDVDSGSLSPALSLNTLVDNFSGYPNTGSPMGRGYRNFPKWSGFGPWDLLPGSPDTRSPIAQGGGRSEKKSGLGESATGVSKVRYSKLSGNTEGGMEFFDKAKSVRLQGHFGKYLVADDDKQTVRQCCNGSSHRARWTVEFVNRKCNTIRLKSCHGLYLTAASETFLLGMTGKKVVQTQPKKLTDISIEWEPVKEGLHVKLMTKDGKLLRANGGIQPWINSVTHGVPYWPATQDCVLWGVDVLDITLSEPDVDSGSLPPASSLDSGSLPPASSFNYLVYFLFFFFCLFCVGSFFLYKPHF